KGTGTVFVGHSFLYNVCVTETARAVRVAKYNNYIRSYQCITLKSRRLGYNTPFRNRPGGKNAV
ncbi:hypothetical protein LN378_27895, partial [Enterobacter hormaechei subsp. steigerwaltii]|nr:hypothetical protein [Enterobacter hormaechei subsp. steigerwaltii]